MVTTCQHCHRRAAVMELDRSGLPRLWLCSDCTVQALRFCSAHGIAAVARAIDVRRESERCKDN